MVDETRNDSSGDAAGGRGGSDGDSRMSFGDHLEELRACLIRALLGLVLAAIVCLGLGREILAIIFYPLLMVQAANRLTPELQALSPTAGFIAYMKIAFLSGLILAMPWLLYQIWKFVSAGLYPHERRFALRLMPLSLGLFVAGVMFLYFIVLPIVLSFLIKFNASIRTFDPEGSYVARLVAPHHKEEAVELPQFGVHVPVYDGASKDVPDGSLWFDSQMGRLKLKTPNGIWWTGFTPQKGSPPIRSQFAIDFYIGFVLRLALAFGLAFQLPIIVFFLAWSGILPAATMARGRRYVILGIVFAAALLTPPDVASQLLLALPMWALFEIGLLAARLAKKSEKARK